MKKILLMNDIAYGGGVEKVMHILIEELRLEGYNITVLTNVYNEHFNKQYGNTEISYIYITKGMFRNSNILGRIYNKIIYQIILNYKIRIINKYNYDIAIAMKEGPCMKFISNINSRRKFAWVHTDFNSFHWTKGVFKKNNELNCMKKYEKVICVSSAVVKGVMEKVGDPGNLIIRYNPINIKNIIHLSQETVTKTDEMKDIDTTLFISVGRLDLQKGFDRLLEACLRLKNEGFNFRLWIIGDGIEKGNLERYIKYNKLTNIILLGEKKNPYKYVKMASWYISPSRSESFSLAIYESIALNIPVITTKCPGAIELFDESVHGLIVENSKDGIYSGMKKVLIDSDFSKSFSKSAILPNNEFNVYNNRVQEITNLLK